MTSHFLTRALSGLLFTSSVVVAKPLNKGLSEPLAITAKLSEWKIELSEAEVQAGTVTFTAMNAGGIPHALEVEGPGLEKETATIQPGASATLTLNLRPGTYEVYCPVGGDSHKKLG